MTVSVSVVLPTYNRLLSLKVACESVLNQSYRDLELIVVDDASTENLRAMIDDLGDDRVRYLRHAQNGGASRARNTGLAAATGRFIAFQDSDDLWLPGKLERQMELMNSLPDSVGVVTGSKILYGRDSAHNYGPGKVTCAPPPGQILKLEEDQVRRFLEGNRISLQNTLFRRECFPGDNWFDPCAKANADWEFTARLAQHTKIYEDIEPVVLAFISADSISTNTRKKALGLLRILKKNRAAFAHYPDVHTKNLIQLARMLVRLGKRRMAWRLIRAGLKIHPRSVIGKDGFSGVIWRRFRNSLAPGSRA
ncbi:glycosyltransferase family 2 protein [Phaeovulum sp.]|uniref:glycosyltransferase family 2 protein n=1 Tax=Phaeovulum sp. TaxID=2934796 RepID=UPI0039E51CB6